MAWTYVTVYRTFTPGGWLDACLRHEPGPRIEGISREVTDEYIQTLSSGLVCFRPSASHHLF